MNRRIRSQLVIDCPREKRMVPLHATAAGADRTQLTCRRCPMYRKETCSQLACKYDVPGP